MLTRIAARFQKFLKTNSLFIVFPIFPYCPKLSNNGFAMKPISEKLNPVLDLLTKDLTFKGSVIKTFDNFPSVFDPVSVELTEEYFDFNIITVSFAGISFKLMQKANAYFAVSIFLAPSGLARQAVFVKGGVISFINTGLQRTVSSFVECFLLLINLQQDLFCDLPFDFSSYLTVFKQISLKN